MCGQPYAVFAHFSRLFCDNRSGKRHNYYSGQAEREGKTPHSFVTGDQKNLKGVGAVHSLGLSQTQSGFSTFTDFSRAIIP
jgi:hypothetical protein